MQDLEFTVQDGDLFLLQTRAGKRTTKAAMRIALDMLEEGLIDRHQAIERTRDIQEEDLVDHQLIANEAKAPIPLAAADVACPGVVCGEVALDPEVAQERAKTGAQVVLVRSDARTEDIAGLQVSVGLLTQRGARTSHAAVVARQLGKPCLVACSDMRIDLAARTLRVSDLVVSEGDLITLDANNGQVYLGQLSIEAIPDTGLVDGLRRLRGQEPAPIPGKSGVHKPAKNHEKDQSKGNGQRKHQGSKL
jgi:pyruvate, orthophosphate dikinase